MISARLGRVNDDEEEVVVVVLGLWALSASGRDANNHHANIKASCYFRR